MYNQEQINKAIKGIYQEKNSMLVIENITEDKIFFNGGRYDFYYVDGDLIFFKSCTGVKRQEKCISSYLSVEEI